MQFLPDSIHQRRLLAELTDTCCLDQFEHLLSLWHSHFSSVADDQSQVDNIAYIGKLLQLRLTASVRRTRAVLP